MEQWVEVGAIDRMAEGAPSLCKADGRRFVCVRRGEEVHALDDRCPHQGYPLSQGTVNGGVLTCQWHNWKFELESGECTFGGEAVRRYPSRVVEGRVFLNVAVDPERERARSIASIRAALVEDDAPRALREALRWDLDAAFGVLALDGAERAQWGFDHGLALLADLRSWADRGWVDAAGAFVAASTAIAEPSRNRGPRPPIEPKALDEGSIADDLIAERRDDALLRVRSLVRAQGPSAAARALLPFVSSRLLDYGHGAIFLAKALELCARFPGASEAIMTAVALELAWATDETSLPPFTATRRAIDAIDFDPGHGAIDRASIEAAVLEGERAGVSAVIDALRRGGDPSEILRALGHAAATRLARFDRAWERRLDAEVGVLDVTHAVTFVDAAIALSREEPDAALRFAIVAAGFVGKLRSADGPAPEPAIGRPLLDRVRARDLPGALGAAHALDPAARRSAYSELAPFAAFESAVRPIFYAHSVKTTEALSRLEENDPQADDVYLRACLSYLVPVTVERQFARIANVARQFMIDQRPPAALY